MQTKSAVKKGISFLLCFFLILAYSVGPFSAMHVDAAVDVGSNPTPKIDIAVNVPSDYPGTFLDFKNELTQKLIEQGLEPGSFRITDTKVSIDTTDLNGWYVYDHYYDQTRYNNLNLSAEQKLKQPYRAADNSYTTGGIVTMESLLKNGNISGCRNFTQHIWSYADEHGKASMVFAGYGTQPYVDYMIYPAASDSRRTISFDIDANAIGPHTLSYYGFLLNAGIENGRLKGYVLNFNQSHAGSITKVDLDQNFSGALGGSVVAGSSMNMGLSSTKKARVTVELNKDKVSVQVQQYDTSGNLSAPQTKLNGVKLENTGFNGFGPIVGYASHGCSELTVFRYLDLEMSYETSAFDALKNIQYYQGAEYKYFINLAGDSGDPGIPLETDPGYQDGINRMNQNDIFYISNADDGRVVTDTTKDENGNPTHQGLGSKNGYIAQGDDYASMMAQYIAKNYTEGVKFTKNEVLSDLPLASFFVKDAATEKSQIMTIHLRHLYNTGETVSVNMYDKSKPGLNATKKDPNAKITQWHYKIYDPKNNVQYDSGWVNDVNKIKDYVFTKDSMSGRWTFELTVRDSEGESKTFQTYATAFWDDKAPIIQGENTSKNKATITLTDTGMGIDEDGITFIEDDRGSGVAAYWITNSTSETPSDSDWIYLDEVQHSYAFDYEITSTEPLVVWVKDECKNVGKQMVFQPIHIVVEDENGNPIDDYYVLDEPIVILPEEVPEPEDPDDAFSGWVVPGGGGSTPEPSKPMTPGTIPEDNDDHTIVIRPSYSKDKANIVYVANGGTVHTSAGDKPMSNSYAVTAGASIETKIEDHNVKPTRVGYSFAGWKLLNSNNADDAVNEAYINNTANLADVEKTVAECHTDKDTLGEHLEDTAVVHKTYYLIAQWKIGNYTLNLDTNGGSYGNMRNIPDVAYGTNIGNLGLPTSGRGIPTKPGYIFQGWSENSGNNSGSNFKPVAGVTASATAPTMPASDKTVYAVWKADSSKFVVTFDTDGGNKIKDQAYQTSTATNYQEIPTPTKAGYTFTGWKIVNEDGSLGEAAVSKGVLLKKENHTLKAVWEANTDTPYAVDYYINSGNKDANGNFIYTKANGYTRDYTGTTEEVVQIPEADKLSEITVDGADYWLDKGNANEVLSGAITGNPTLSLKLYYNRYFNVTVTGDADKGTFTSATKQLEGATPTVSWQAKEGYHVAKILVDGKIRDDLLNATSYTLEEGIHANHTVQVVLESGAENPDMPKPNYYQVTTSILGCTDGTCTITDTMRVRPGESAKVEWNVPAERGWNITKILVDGQELADLTVGAVEMDRIAADHSVVVFVSKLPTIGGNQTEGQYTVTVNRYGGDEQTTVSESATNIEKNQTYKFSWNAGDNYSVYEVYIDGVKQNRKFDAQGLMNIKVDGNKVIDIYFAEKPKDENGDVIPDTPVIPPTFDKDEYIKITTKIEGGPGTITGGAVIKAESDYDVNWEVKDNSTNPDSPDYTYYEVTDIVVNGESVGSDADKLNFKEISEDTTVVVKVEPKMHDVDLYKYGQGSISASKKVWHLQNYNNITATPAEGYRIAKIVVDGEILLDTKEITVEVPVTPEQPEDPETKENPADPEQDEPTPEVLGFSDEDGIMPMAEGDEGETTPTTTTQTVNVVEKNQDGINTTKARTDIELQDENISEDGFKMGVKGAVDNYKVEVYFTRVTQTTIQDPDNPDGPPITVDVVDPVPDPEELANVSVKIEGGPAEVGTDTTDEGHTGVYNKGETGKVTWKVPSGYSVESVTVNGEEVTVTENELIFDAINEDKNVVVKLKKDGATNEPEKPTYKVKTFEIQTEIRGAGGTISGAGLVNEGDTAKVTWSVADPDHYEVKYVLVDGEVVPGLRTLEEVSLLADKDHKVVVIIDQKAGTTVPTNPAVPPTYPVTPPTGPTNPPVGPTDPTKPTDPTDPGKDDPKDPGKDDPKDPTDPDDPKDPGKDDPKDPTDPDDPKDPGKEDPKDPGKDDPKYPTPPGTPIDPSKPNVDIDTDGDGQPDIDIDTDGDGKPDLNVDTDGDGKPDINIDTTGDGKPDLNVDTTGDGKADTNIDTDGDGKPDKNVVDSISGSNVPRTEDASNMMLWLTILGASIVSLLGAAFGLKKTKTAEK